MLKCTGTMVIKGLSVGSAEANLVPFAIITVVIAAITTTRRATFVGNFNAKLKTVD